MLALVELGSLQALIFEARQEAAIQCSLNGGCSYTELCRLLDSPLACMPDTTPDNDCKGGRIARELPEASKVQKTMQKESLDRNQGNRQAASDAHEQYT